MFNENRMWDRVGMETVELFDIGEDEIKGILDIIPIYRKRKNAMACSR